MDEIINRYFQSPNLNLISIYKAIFFVRHPGDVRRGFPVCFYILPFVTSDELNFQIFFITPSDLLTVKNPAVTKFQTTDTKTQHEQHP